MRLGNSHLFQIIAGCSILLLAAIAQARAASITVTDAWIRALPASVPSGGYFTLHNGTDKTITLVGAQSPGCGMLMLHKSENAGGMSEMQDVAQIDVPAGGTVKFAPGGYHLMCMDSTKLIRPGAKVPMTLLFKDGAKLTEQFPVRNAAGRVVMPDGGRM